MVVWKYNAAMANLGPFDNYYIVFSLRERYNLFGRYFRLRYCALCDVQCPLNQIRSSYSLAFWNGCSSAQF